MSALVMPSSFSTPSSTGSPWVSHPALRCTWKPLIVLYLLNVSLILLARTWWIPGWPLADGGPSKNTNCGHPLRSSILLWKISFFSHCASTSLLVCVRFNPLCSANLLAITYFCLLLLLFFISVGKGTIKWAKYKMKTCFYFHFRTKVPYLKVRLSERNTKWKHVFIFISERKYLTQLSQVERS